MSSLFTDPGGVLLLLFYYEPAGLSYFDANGFKS